MHVLFGGLLAMALAPAGDPRTIDPAANRPEIVAPGGSPSTVAPVTTRPPKTEGKPKVEPKVEPAVEPAIEPQAAPKPGRRPTAALADAGQPARCFAERGRCWRLGVTGIVAASVGVSAIGTGIGFMLAPQYAVPDEPTFNRSLRPAGVAMVAVGAVHAVAGVLLVVAGHASHGKPRPDTARAKLVPGGLRW
jgi:hypothetical protein